MKIYNINKLLQICIFIVLGSSFVYGQSVTSVIVELKTGDKRFAGTDDPVHILIGGLEFNLDNPNHDDLERNNTDTFTLTVNDPEFTVEMIKAVGRIGIVKTEDSFFGGGWYFQGIKVWLNSQTSDPIYTNDSIGKWMDGEIAERTFYTDFGEAGWNLPEPAPFPPCQAPPIIFLTKAAKPDDSGKKLDSDCDGIPDDVDPTFDPNQPDADGDGLPDVYEGQNGSNPNDNDSDNDGWLDGRNIRDVLILTKIECLDQTGWTNLGTDETYLASEDVRFPLSPGLDNYWEMDADNSIEPFLVIDSRTPGNSTPQYKSRLNLREADLPILEHPLDDGIFSGTLDWARNETKEIDLSDGDSHYKLFFKSFTVNFTDPSLTADGDVEDDGLKDSMEFMISTQSPTLRPATVAANDGFNGLANPLKKQLFIEVDSVGSDDKMPFDAKMQVASQFYYHNVSMRIDDGYLGGGDILPYKDVVTFDEMKADYYPVHQFDERKNHYRYALYVPSMEGQSNGRADRPGKRLIVSRSTMVGSFSAIVFIHELGHTLSLCHPFPASEPPSPSTTCPTPTGWDGFCSTCFCEAHEYSCCRHYCGVGDHDVTAMGSDIGTQAIVIGGGIGIMVGLVIIALFIPGIGWLAGAALLLATTLVGAFTGFLFSDAYLRLVDYHVNEWAVIILNAFQ